MFTAFVRAYILMTAVKYLYGFTICCYKDNCVHKRFQCCEEYMFSQDYLSGKVLVYEQTANKLFLFL